MENKKLQELVFVHQLLVPSFGANVVAVNISILKNKVDNGHNIPSFSFSLELMRVTLLQIVIICKAKILVCRHFEMSCG